MIRTLFGVDWRTTGPRELAGRGWRRFGGLPWWGQTALIGVGLYGLYRLWIALPVWGAVALFSTVAGLAVAFLPTKRISDELASDEAEILEELQPADGDRATRKLSQDRFEDMTVVDYHGDEHDASSYLVEVSRMVGEDDDGNKIYRKGYEVDRYYPDRNLAVASYMAGASNADLRRYRQAIYEVKSELSKEADRSLEEIVQAPEARRRAASSAVQSVIEAAENIESPDGPSMIDELDKLRREGEESVDKLLADRGIDDMGERIEESNDEDGDDGAKSPDSVEISIGDPESAAENGGEPADD
ncbi:hypothetical protein [Salinarchaeum laminariae]|uniref:hypothetical protein n=1 Tax=Salinarchaeum laminariae TaxID=869888 RepID=UPI0020C00410|nr:hypothetical protein [Salinarchaeum laminariae]